MSAVFSRRPWGRNECVTNEPQRTSAGRLPCGVLLGILGGSSLLRRGLFVLWGGWGEKESVWETVVPRAFYFFDYCYFYRDTQWEPLWRREWSGGVPPCSPNPDPISDQKM